jgi:putative ABC transport system substrate-binding protein
MALMGGTSVAWPLAARAQPRPTPVIGYLGTTTYEASSPFLAAFREGLKESGYVEERNVAIVYRWAEGRHDRFPALAAKLVALKVAVIVATNLWSALAAQRATRTIPIVFLTGRPVELGLAASHSRPGGNATGVDIFLPDLIPKRLELLRDLLPAARSVAYLVDPESPNAAYERAQVEAAARATGHDVRLVEVRTGGEIEQAFARFAAHRPDAILTGASPLFFIERHQMIALVARHAIPAIHEWPDQAAAGGLISYGPNLKHAHRLVGVYTGKILAGARPADLPVQRLTKLELVINLKTARALGLTVPTALLDRADEVIE